MYRISPHSFVLSNTYNLIGESSDVVIWSFIEDYTAVICASLITIRPLLSKYMPSMFRNQNTTCAISHHRWMRSTTAVAVRGYSHGSAIELKAVESWKGVEEWGKRLRGGSVVESLQAHSDSQIKIDFVRNCCQADGSEGP